MNNSDLKYILENLRDSSIDRRDGYGFISKVDGKYSLLDRSGNEKCYLEVVEYSLGVLSVRVIAGLKSLLNHSISTGHYGFSVSSNSDKAVLANFKEGTSLVYNCKEGTRLKDELLITDTYGKIVQLCKRIDFDKPYNFLFFTVGNVEGFDEKTFMQSR